MRGMATMGGGSGRSTATVLFTDLVASTELRSRLGESAAEEVRRRHDRLLAEAVQAHQGRIVKHLGDGIMAAFAAAADSVAAAIAIQRAQDRHNRSAAGSRSGHLDIRIGISAGDVTFEEEDCFGSPVIEASRLCAAASGGQILASGLVQGLVGAGGGMQFRSVGALELKGLPAPVSAVEVEWAAGASRALPLPPGLERPGMFRFVGREAERQLLARAWKEAAAGERRVVLVDGDAGIGKTRLMGEVAQAVHDEGAAVLYGRCDEDLGIPYQPVAEALQTYAAACPPDELRAQLGSLGGELVTLVPWLPERVPGLPEPMRGEPETERYRLLEAVRGFVAGISETAPVLLVLDDLHWAPKPTIAMLRHLARPREIRLLVAGTYRATDLSRTHPLTEALADLRREHGVERVALSGLEEAEVAAFVEATAGHALDEEDLAFARTVWAETEGNPFFVGEVLRHLAETGAVVRRAGRWRVSQSLAELGIPEGVREVIGRRLSRLPESTSGLLAVAAVIGRDFDVDLLATAAELGQEEVLDALAQAEAARLVGPVAGRVDRYSFVHALVRSTLSEDLPTSRRVRLHRRIGLALEARPDADARLPELARHFGEAAGLGEVDRAVRYARRAGETARGGLAFEEAAIQYERALAALEASREPDTGLGCDLRIALGEALHRSGDPRYREVLMEAAAAARALADTHRLGEIALALNPMGFSSEAGKADQDVVTLVEQALAGLGDTDTALRARLLAVLAVELVWTPDFERRLALVEEAAAVAHRLGDRTTLARVLASAHLAVKDPDHVAERLSWTGELVALGAELGEPETAFSGHLLRHDDLLGLGDLQTAHADLDAAERLVTDLHQPLYLWRVATRRTGQAMLAGRLSEAEGLIRWASRMGEGRVSPGYARAVETLQLLMLRYDQGRMGELEEAVAQLIEAMPGLSAMWRASLALVYCETGRPAEAESHLEQLTANLADIPRDFLWIPVMVALASVTAALGDRARSATLYERLEPYAGRTGGGAGIMTFGIVGLSLGVLAATLRRFDDAEGHFAASADLCQRMKAPTWLARTQLEWARMLAVRDTPEDAERMHQLASEAVAAAEELGMARIAEHSRALVTQG